MAIGGDINDRLAELAGRVAALEARLNEIVSPKRVEPAPARHEEKEASHSTEHRRR